MFGHEHIDDLPLSINLHLGLIGHIEQERALGQVLAGVGSNPLLHLYDLQPLGLFGLLRAQVEVDYLLPVLVALQVGLVIAQLALDELVVVLAPQVPQEGCRHLAPVLPLRQLLSVHLLRLPVLHLAQG